MNTRNNQGGWYQESQRHSLARRGVKTGARVVGRGLLTTGSLVAEGLKDDYSSSSYDDDLERQVKSDDHLSDAEEVVGSAWDENPDGEDDSFSIIGGADPYADKVDREVRELHQTMEYGDWRKEQSDKTRGILSSIRKFYFGSDRDSLEEEVAKLEAQRMVYKDKLAIVDSVRKDVMSRKYRDASHLEEQFKAVETVDRQLGLLMADLNKVDAHLDDAKSKLNKLTRSAENGIAPEKRFSIFPSFGEARK